MTKTTTLSVVYRLNDDRTAQLCTHNGKWCITEATQPFSGTRKSNTISSPSFRQTMLVRVRAALLCIVFVDLSIGYSSKDYQYLSLSLLRCVCVCQTAKTIIIIGIILFAILMYPLHTLKLFDNVNWVDGDIKGWQTATQVTRLIFFGKWMKAHLLPLSCIEQHWVISLAAGFVQISI